MEAAAAVLQLGPGQHLAYERTAGRMGRAGVGVLFLNGLLSARSGCGWGQGRRGLRRWGLGRGRGVGGCSSGASWAPQPLHTPPGPGHAPPAMRPTGAR
jgi:hypothetical protein